MYEEEIFIKNPFIISDTHFGHLMIERYCGRPSDWTNLIIDNWNKSVGKEDVVFFLGDFALAPKDDVAFYKSLLNGKIFMIKGNHDHLSWKFYESVNFIMLREKEIKYKNLIFSHRPMIKLPNFTYNIHGHTHEKPNRDKWHVNCSVERMNYTPKRLDEIIKEYNIILTV
jgi:calcineurin-like phosphoesterase family protein